MYRILAYKMSFTWLFPEEFWVESKEEADELAAELKNQQYSVDIEYVEEG